MTVHEEVCQCLEKDVVTSFSLRDLFVGTTVDESRLKKTTFARTGESAGYTRWEKYWNRKKNKACLVVAPHGTLCQIDLLEWLDIAIDDYIGAAYAHGWHFSMQCAKQSENTIRHELMTCTSDRQNSSATEELSSTVERLGIDRSQLDSGVDEAYILCANANDAKDHAPPLARLLCTILTRHHREIDNQSVLYDLPYLCGRLGLLSECAVTARYLLGKLRQLPATCWSNLGAVLTDNVRQHRAGFLCFREAITVDPHLPQPRQGIWHAGKRLMHEQFVRSDFETAGRIADEVVAVGNKRTAPHGFFVYQGLAYEMTNRRDDALEAYRQALVLNDDCGIACSGIERLEARTQHQEQRLSAFNTPQDDINRMVESGAFSDLAPEDRYLWTCGNRS